MFLEEKSIIMYFNQFIKKNRNYSILQFIGFFVICFFVYRNIAFGAISYLVDSNYKLIIFGNIFMILLFYRYKIYLQFRNFVIIREGLDNYIKNVMRSELIFFAKIVLFNYVVLALVLQIENLTVYLIQSSLHIFILLFIEVFLIKTIYEKNEIQNYYLYFYIILIIHNYFIEPIMFKILGF